MRILLRILLFPISICLTVLLLFLRFVCALSGAVLNLLCGMVFLIGLGTLVLLADPKGAIQVFIMAFVFSPLGVPLLAEWLLNRMDNLCCKIKSI